MFSGKVPVERKKSDAWISVKQEGDSRVVLGWDWRFEESRIVPLNVIRMSAVGDAQGLTEVRVLPCRKLKLYEFVPLSHNLYSLRMEKKSGGW